MTRKSGWNHSPSFIPPVIAILILSIAFGVLAQTTGAGQRFAGDAVVSAPQDAGALAQVLWGSPMPKARDAGRVPMLRSQRNELDAGPTGSIPLIFLPAAIYSSGEPETDSVAVADVNDDGKPDIVLANFISGLVSVLLGNGDGTFQTAVTYGSGGINPMSVAIADVNGDGKPDIVVANLNSGSVGVLLGNGDGTFRPALTFGAGTRTMSVAVADVNGDGKPDIVVADQDGYVGVLLGNGDGTFLPIVIYGAGGAYTTWVAVADVNGDGKPDIVVANEDGYVGVLLGNGNGTFRAAVTYGSGGGSPDSVAIADLNGDGKPDIVVANYWSSVGVLLGNGDGTFQPAVIYSSGSLGVIGPVSVTVADLNDDGKPDLLVTNLFTDWPSDENGTVGVLLGNGDGTFQPAVTYSSGATFAESLAVSDVNGDGKPDIVVANAGVVGVLLNNYGAPPTSTSLASNVNPANLNQQVTYTVTVAGEFGGALNGAVTFQDGTRAIATVILANNQATYNTSYKTISTHAITASYSGVLHDAGGSRSATLTEHVRGPSRMVLTTSGSPSSIGQPVTFSASVTSRFGTIPNGEQVTFYDRASAIGTGSTDNGTATFTTSSLTAGTHVINATYAGDVTFDPSVGTVKQTVNGYTTSTLLTSSLNPSIYGQKESWTATVTSSASIMPTGTVKFTWSIYTIGSATLNSSGVATFSRSNLNADSYPLTAVYAGDAANQGSTSAVVNQVVLETTSTAAITSSPNPSAQGQAVNFTAKISSPTVTPTGPVTFTAGQTVLGTAQLSGGKATLTTSSLPVGSTKVTVTYNGDSNIAKSSASVTQTVQ